MEGLRGLFFVRRVGFVRCSSSKATGLGAETEKRVNLKFIWCCSRGAGRLFGFKGRETGDGNRRAKAPLLFLGHARGI